MPDKYAAEPSVPTAPFSTPPAEGRSEGLWCEVTKFGDTHHTWLNSETGEQRITDAISTPTDGVADRSGEVDDSPCDRCWVHYQGLGAIWTTDSHIWNGVVGGDPYVEASGMLCPTCFCIAAKEDGVEFLWRLVPERRLWPDEPKQPGGSAPKDPNPFPRIRPYKPLSWFRTRVRVLRDRKNGDSRG